MPRYVAFLRGVSPMNAKMPELKSSFEGAGFSDVKTVLSSGNVVFTTRETLETTLATKAEAAMQDHLGRLFPTIIRSVKALQSLLAMNPFSDFSLQPTAKRVVTFLRKSPQSLPPIPIEREGVRILAITELEVFTAYVPNPRGPIFMTLIEKTFGKDVTTRTWETVQKCASA
jgi:uncharacterized protein (DUF1697 family)